MAMLACSVLIMKIFEQMHLVKTLKMSPRYYYDNYVYISFKTCIINLLRKIGSSWNSNPGFSHAR